MTDEDKLKKLEELKLEILGRLVHMTPHPIDENGNYIPIIRTRKGTLMEWSDGKSPDQIDREEMQKDWPEGKLVRVLNKGLAIIPELVGKVGEITDVYPKTGWVGVYFGGGGRWIPGMTWNVFFEDQLEIVGDGPLVGSQDLREAIRTQFNE